MSALPRPGVTGAARVLNDALHDLHHRAGWPSLRTLARETGVSHTTVSKVFSSPAVPPWGTVELLVEAMRGDVAGLHELWLAATAPMDGGPAPAPRIAGRRGELAAVRRHLETGTGLLLVTGEAGIGKTTLVTAGGESVRPDRLVVTGHCLPLSTEIPLLPFAEALRQVHAIDGGRLFTKAMATCPEYVVASLSRLLPELAGVATLIDPQDEWSRERLYSAIASVLGALSAQRSFALVIEDLHWADDPSLDLVERLTHRPEITTVGTWRINDPDVPHSRLTWWHRVRRGAASLELAPLSREETAAQLRLLRPDITDAIVRRIHARSQGQPLFTEQLAHEESGAPSTFLGELLDGRIGRLDGEAWRAASALGVADRPMTEAALAHATGLDRPRLTHSLRELRDARLLETLADTVHLRHPLLAEAVRRRLLPGETAEVHRSLARTMSSDPDAEPAEVAAHWQGASDRAEELTWRIRAAQAASARFAGSQAADHWMRALDLWPPGAGTAGEPPLRRQALVVGVVAAMELAGHERTGRPFLEAALSAPQELDTAERADLLRLLARPNSTQFVRGDRGLELVDQSIALFRSLPPSAGLALALNWKATELEWHGRRREATTTLEEAAQVAVQVGDVGLERTVRAQQIWHQAVLGADGAVSSIASLAEEHPFGADPKHDLYVAIRHTDILLMACRPAVEVQAAAQPAFDSADRWNMTSVHFQVLRCNVAQAWRRAGVVSRARRVMTSAPDHDDSALPFVQCERALLEMLAGRLDVARVMLRVLGSGSAGHGHPAAVDVGMQLALWAGDPEEAWRQLGMLLGTRDDELAPGTVGDLLVLAARAAGDMAQLAPDADRRDLHGSANALRTRLHHDPYSPSAVPSDRAAHPQWSAELERIRGSESLDGWHDAARAWDELVRPHDAAYCRWRGAQVALREGQGTVAARLLRRAATDAREHVPLSEAIAATRTNAS